MASLDLLGRAVRYSRQNPWLATVSVVTIALSLTLVAIFALAVSNARLAVSDWSRDLQLVIYLDPAPSEETARQWRTALSSIAEVEQVTFVDPATALRRFRARLGGNAELLDGIEAEVLPASMEITLKSQFRTQAAVNALVDRLKQNSDWRDIHFARDWVSRFDAVVRLLKLVGTALGGFLLFASLFIVANTIRLVFQARREEIEVLRLVGATPLYVQLPFVLEGMLLGAFGGGVALLLAYGMYLAGIRQGLVVLLQSLGVTQVHFLPPLWQAGVVLAGSLVGLIGSLVGMRSLRSE